MNPYFSIITASFNSAKTIEKTLESVVVQSFTNFEYIIIDGGSQDETFKIIKSFKQKFAEKNITYKYISEKDQGIYDAWNKGLKFARGEWISFLGSDDMYLPDALKLYRQEISKNTADINYISSQVQLINDKGDNLNVFGKIYNWNKVIRDIDTAQVGSFHKRELFDLAGNFSLEYRIVGDLDFYIRCKDFIKPAYFAQITAKMLNSGVSNQIYTALKEARNVKLKYGHSQKVLVYYDFLSSLAKCYIKILIKKK